MSGPFANYDNDFGGKKDECQGCIGISDEHTCDGYAEFLAMKAEKDKCQNCARLQARVAALENELRASRCLRSHELADWCECGWSRAATEQESKNG